ncbi:UGSC family (seleno)protein [Novosphingobium bradum]|uniref:UGSC family (Seleno)protein n=1 Tax=Novosphingobium bradum TaxID=1737444 RepID=A0ABV7IQL2_9SPHN
MTITILDPRGQGGPTVTPYALACDPRRDGLRIGLLSNCFFDATNLLRALGEVLVELLPGARVSLYECPNASLIAEPELIARVASENDVAVTALGHCGSCTSSATRDAVNLARAGLPVGTLISDKFYEASHFVARSVGMPDVPRVRLPHPVAGTGAARIAAIAREAAPRLIATWQGALADAA